MRSVPARGRCRRAEAPPPAPVWLSWAALAALCVAATVAGCANPNLPPPIAADAACSTCGMSASSARFACERRDGNRWLVFDSIECMARSSGASDAALAWLPDYDQARLHRADSLWIVRGKLATPMGGGLAAFLERDAAEAVARNCDGRVTRWGDPALVAEPGR